MANAPRVELRDGAVTGREGDGVLAFRGIPYATVERFASPCAGAATERRSRRHRLRPHRPPGAGRPVPAAGPGTARAVPLPQRVDTGHATVRRDRVPGHGVDPRRRV